jgi:hypothetical protein
VGPGGEKLLSASGAFTALRWLDATALQREQALPPTRAMSILAELAAEARAGSRGTLQRLLELTPFCPSTWDLHSMPLDAWLIRIEEGLCRKQIAFVPGWDWRRAVASAPARAEPLEAPLPAPPARPAPRERTHQLRFEYMTNTGHPITDDAGFELRGPDGTVQKGKLENGRLHRTEVEPGSYELRLRAFRSARWSRTSAAPFEPIALVVATRGFPDGTELDLVIRPAYGPPDAAGFFITAEVQSNQARATWAYEQGIGGRLGEQFRFEASASRKRARSNILSITAHPSGTALGTQERLRARGYDPGPPADGETAAFRAALQRFQADHPPLIASGELDPFTVEQLDDPFAAAAP